jgi:hypothetical protein
MNEKDPILKIEQMIKEMHDKAGNFTRPVLSRYPLLFAFLLTFSAAAILHGFKGFVDQIEIFEKHPLLLIGIGVISLALTGTLYNLLKKAE